MLSLMRPRHLIPGTPESYSRFLPGGRSPRPPVRQGQIGIVPHASLQDRREDPHEPTPAELDALFDTHVLAILAAIRGHETFDIIGALGLVNVVADLEREDEYAGHGLIAAAELGSAICASTPARVAPEEPVQASVGPLGSPGDAVWSIQDRLIACVLISGPSDEAHATRDTAFHRFFDQTHTIRNDRFDHQEHEILEALFGLPHIATACRSALGFDADDALVLWDAISSRCEAAYEAAAADPTDPTHGIGEALTLRCVDLARETLLADSVVASFLDVFSVALGDVELPQRTDDSMVIRRRPLIRDGERFVCTAPANLLRAIRAVLEDGLKVTAGWESYQRHRGRYCESRALGILADFLRPDLALTGLSFDSVQGNGECDALLVLGDTALILEVKSGTLRAGRNTARAEALDWTVKELIEHPASQIERARAALLAGSLVHDSSGPLDLPFGHISRVYGLIVTLEPLAFAAPMLWQLQDEGLLSAGPSLPWLIGLHELESICQVLEFPVQLLHFLNAHQRMDQLRCVEAVDEIDVLMAYLDMGLRFAWLPPAERILLPPDSDQLNNWVFYRRGVRKTVTPRPQQYFPMTSRLAARAALRQLDVERPNGFISSSFVTIEAALEEADAERLGHGHWGGGNTPLTRSPPQRRRRHQRKGTH
jgi:hypothetical protein